MVFSDTSTNQGVIQEIESIIFASDYGKISGSTSLLQTFTRYCNQALDIIIPQVMEVDGSWKLNESSATDNLVDNQSTYTIPVTYLKMLGVSIKDSNGDWRKLTQIDPLNLYIDRAEFLKTKAMPLYYDLSGQSLILYPAPSSAEVTTTSGLKYYYQSTPSYFATSDTTKVSEIPSVFHRLVPLWASYFYCQANTITQKMNAISEDIRIHTDLILKSYNERNVDYKKMITARANRSR